MTQSTKQNSTKVQFQNSIHLLLSMECWDCTFILIFFFYLTGHNCKFSLSFLTSIIRKIGKTNTYLSQNYPAENCVFIFDFNL